jgi:hypothetical protein
MKTEADLKKLKVQELKQLLTDAGLNSSGTQYRAQPRAVQ